MKITYLENRTGNHLFDVDGTQIYLWNSGRSLISLNDFSNRIDLEAKMFDEGNVDQMTAFIENNEIFVTQYIKTAVAAKTLQNSYRNIPVKHFVSVNNNKRTVMLTKVDLTRGYVSITTSEMRVEREKDIIRYNKNSYTEMFIYEEGLKPREANQKFWDMVRIDGIGAIADISGFYHSFSFRKSEYYFTFNGSGNYEISDKHPQLKPLIELAKSKQPDMLKAIYEFSKLPDTSEYINQMLAAGRSLVSKSK